MEKEKKSIDKNMCSQKQQEQTHAQATARACCFALMRSTQFKPPEKEREAAYD